MTKAFRPQSWNGKFKLRQKVGLYHHHERRSFNEHIYRVGGQLHYLAHHAPINVMKKWKFAAKKFELRYRKKV